MAATLYLTVSFGGSKAGLTTVGFRLYDASNAQIGGRVSSDIVDLGSGQYGCNVNVPDGFRGRITWDTGETPTPVSVSAQINPEELDQDAGEAEAIEEIRGEVYDIARDVALVRAGQAYSRPGQPGDVALGDPADPTSVYAAESSRDGCPILGRFNAYSVDQGSTPSLVHVFRNRAGRPLDLTRWLGGSGGSLSSSSSGGAYGSVVLRVREWIGGDCRAAEPEDLAGSAANAAKGVVSVRLPADATLRAGIYELNWAVRDADGAVVAVDRSIMSVERSLFASAEELRANVGPPTLREVRMMMMDASASDNLLLDDVEFGDEEVLLALAAPVRMWNETPPPIEKYTTATFPYRGAWIDGVLGELHIMAGNKYRRNRLAHSAGGVSVDDMNKEREYVAEGQRRREEYRRWLLNKKVECNARKFYGGVSSDYARGWW